MDFIKILSILGLAQGLILCAFLVIHSGVKTNANRFLAVLIISIILRVTKSVLLKLGIDFGPVFINIGLAGFFAIGPSLLLYLKSYFSGKAQLSFSYTTLHYLPSLALVAVSPILPHNTSALWWNALYLTILIQLFAYLIISARYYLQHRPNIKKERLWFNTFLVGVGLVWLAYFINFFYLNPVSSPSYLVGAILSTFLIYCLSYLLLINSVRLSEKYEHSSLTKEQRETYVEKIQSLLIDDQIFKDPDITLKKASEISKIPLNSLSQLVNEVYKQSFTSLINSHRIDEAKRLIIEHEKKYKIAHIAYTSGFSSVSAFNASFKKFTGTTPSDFQKEGVK